jgi:D-inositol-3-phosphate glycosyltransferase
LKGKNELKIAMLSVHSCPLGRIGEEDTGGMSVYIREVACELGKLGHRVDVYTRSHKSIHHQVVEIGQNARLIHLKAGEEAIGKLEIYDHVDDFARNIEDFSKQNGLRYDLIHSHYWLSGLAGKRLQEWTGLPHVVGFHTLGAVKNAIGIGELEPELRVHAEKELVRDCHRIIASTCKGKEELIRYYGALPAKVSIVPCGVNMGLFKPIMRAIARSYTGLNGDRIILFVGRIVPEKGVDKLVQAVSCLQGKQRIKLVIIGGDDRSPAEIQRLKNLARSLKIDDSVTFLGLIAHDELPFFYSAADVCVVPSYHESFGLVVLESLACGTPVVATKVGSAEIVIRHGETGYLVKNNDPHCLADSISQLMSKLNNHQELTSLVRASVTKYDWPNITDALIAEYRTVLGDS